jgi:hypothetical protein
VSILFRGREVHWVSFPVDRFLESDAFETDSLAKPGGILPKLRSSVPRFMHSPPLAICQPLSSKSSGMRGTVFSSSRPNRPTRIAMGRKQTGDGV